MSITDADLRAMQERAVAAQDRWFGRGTFVHDPMLDSEWLVDGIGQDDELSEATLDAALTAHPNAQVAVGAPQHLILARIIGYTPQYGTARPAARPA